MASIKIQLLGGFHLFDRNQEIDSISQIRQQLLLAYLMLHCLTRQSRQSIAFTFWPDIPESSARSNLRQALYQLRRKLPEAENYLVIGSSHVQWLPDSPFSLDVLEFENTLQQANKMEQPGQKRAHLEAALSHYRGDLLPDCYDDCMPYWRGRHR
jgi:DNA-binding SARP family transcriptional activator